MKFYVVMIETIYKNIYLSQVFTSKAEAEETGLKYYLDNRHRLGLYGYTVLEATSEF